MSITSEAKQEVERLVRTGQKIEAIKYVHDVFNVSLLDAKKLVEAVEAEMGSFTPSVNPYAMAAEPVAPISPSKLSGTEKVQVDNFLRAGQKIQAVKYVKELFRIGLKESLTIVEEVEREINPNAVPSSVGSGCARGTFTLVSLIFGFAGFISLGIAGINFYLHTLAIEHSDRIAGRVIGLKSSSGGFAPVIAYTWNNREYQYTSTIFSSPADFSPGDKAYVYVNREKPEEVLIDTFSERWLAITVLGGLGILFVFFSGIMVFIRGRF